MAWLDGFLQRIYRDGQALDLLGGLDFRGFQLNADLGDPQNPRYVVDASDVVPAEVAELEGAIEALDGRVTELENAPPPAPAGLTCATHVFSSTSVVESLSVDHAPRHFVTLEGDCETAELTLANPDNPNVPSALELLLNRASEGSIAVQIYARRWYGAESEPEPDTLINLSGAGMVAVRFTWWPVQADVVHGFWEVSAYPWGAPFLPP